MASHYGDVIMGTIASLITSPTVVYSTVYSDANERKHQSSASLAFVRGIHRAQMASNAENVSIWWRHHDMSRDCNLMSCNIPRALHWSEKFLMTTVLYVTFHVCCTQMFYFLLPAAEMLNKYDPHVDPCSDFYEYSCGTWIRKTVLDADQQRITTMGSLKNEVIRSLKRKYLHWRHISVASHMTEKTPENF